MKKYIYILVCLAIGITTINKAYSQVFVEKSNNAVQLNGNYYYVHRVLKGQTLYSISKAYGVTENDILKANSLNQGVIIKARSYIYVPYKSDSNEVKKEAGVKQKAGVHNSVDVLESTIAPLSTSKTQQKTILPIVNRDSVADSKAIETIPGKIKEQTLFDSSKIRENRTYNGSVNVISTLGEKVRGVFLKSNDLINNRNGRDLVNGALLAAKFYRESGVDIEIEQVNGIEYSRFDGAISFIVAMDDQFEAASGIAQSLRVPIIAPLLAIEGGNGYAIEFAPQNNRKYVKYINQFNDVSNNVVLLQHDTYSDTAAMNEIMPYLPYDVNVLDYNRSKKAGEIANKLDKSKTNIIVVPVNHQGSVEDILSKITSINSLRKDYKIKVVGTNRWKNLSNINPELLFKANVSYPTSYHSDRSDEKIIKFYNDYINRYGKLPNAFAMRGYDIVAIMALALPKMQQNLLTNLTQETFTPLQTPYVFNNSLGYKTYNTDWVIVNMTPDYTIVTE